MATTRLRKTFKYPEDEDNTEGRDEMDEQEQADLLTTLETQNTTSNQTLYPFLLSLPLLSLTPFLYILLSPSPTPLPTVIKFMSLLSITSLLSTTYTFGYLSPLSPFHPHQDPSTRKARPSEVFNSPSSISSQLSPVQKYLPRLNWFLAAAVAVSGSYLRRTTNWTVEGGEETSNIQLFFWLWCLVPGMVLVVLEISSRAMEDVEKDLGRLEGLKYGYKGA